MKRILLQLVPVFTLVIVSSLPAYGFGGGSMSTNEQEKPILSEEIKELTIPVRQEGSMEVIQIPMFSEAYAQTPVAIVNEEPITMKEFMVEVATLHNAMGDSETPASRSFTKLLDRLITIKLVKQEALNIGFDQTPSVQKQVEEFALKTLIKQLLARQIAGLQPDEETVETLYRQMALEVKTVTYRFHQQHDAEALLSDLRAGGDFIELADKMVAGDKAQGGGESEYQKLNDLLPNVARAVFDMELGEVSEVFKGTNDFLVFRLEERRVYEDPEVRLAAQQMALQQKADKVQREYLGELIDKYATFNDDAMALVDFEKIAAENPDASRTEVLDRIKNEQRSLVTITNGKETLLITVSDVAGALKAEMYHGVDSKINASQMNNQKVGFLQNKLTAVTGKMEAEAQKIHLSAEYLEKIEKFEERVLFDTFLAKAVVPGLVVKEEDVRRYYYNHLEDYASPLMLKMKSLAFTSKESAQDALKKLQAGSDFKWVSANMTGLADAEDPKVLNLGDHLLAVTALPDDLQHELNGARQGDMYVYSGPDNLFYTLVVDTAFPPEAQTYEEVRQEIGKIVYGKVINEALEEWVVKLKEAYETEIFLVQNDH
ncbi:MAG: peptidyl-prolyl cis-trans isomerase [Desulfuromonadales bacterium]|nr:peptidyl-prolyl cis-trans isomerase [Desulfuromonadales bacterium]